MKKTNFKNQKSAYDLMVDDFNKLERNLKQLRDVLAVICLQQPDHEVMVSWDDIRAIPKGTELEVSSAAGAGAQGFYVFRAITPANESTAGAANDVIGRAAGGQEGGGQGDRGDLLRGEGAAGEGASCSGECGGAARGVAEGVRLLHAG